MFLYWEEGKVKLREKICILFMKSLLSSLTGSLFLIYNKSAKLYACTALVPMTYVEIHVEGGIFL